MYIGMRISLGIMPCPRVLIASWKERAGIATVHIVYDLIYKNTFENARLSLFERDASLS